MNPSNLVDYISQQVAVNHSIDRAFENCRDYVTPIAAFAPCEAPQISEESGASCLVGQNSFFVVHERHQFVTSDTSGISSPIAPSVRWIDRTLELLPGERRLLFPLKFQVIEELQEHDPRQHR